MKQFQELKVEQLAEITGGGKAGKSGGLLYTLLGEWDDFKAGFKAGVKH